MKFEMSFEPVDVTKNIHYPVRKDIMDKVHPSRLDLFIRDLLLEVSKYPEVWDPSVINGRRTDIWRVIKDAFRSNPWGPWGGFNTPTTLLEKAEAIFYDQRYQFYCDYIEYYQFVEGSTIDGYWFLQKNAPSDYEELFKIVLKERLFYPECSPIRKSITYEHKNEEQEVDIEEDLWMKMERDNSAKDVEKASEARNKDSIQISENTRTSFPKLSKDSNKTASNVKNWRSHLNENLRVLFVSELAKKLYSASQLVDCFVEEAKNYENEMFWKANNKEEYYRLFGDKLTELNVELQVQKSSLESESVVSEEARASKKPEYPNESYDWSDGEANEDTEEDYYETSGGYEGSYSDTEVYLVKFGREETTGDAVLSKQMARLGVDPVRTVESAATSSLILNEPKDVKTTGESEIAFEKPNYDDLEEGFFENTIVPAVEAAKKTMFHFGKSVLGKIKNILVEDGPKSEERSSREEKSPKQAEMNIMDSQGTETRNIRDKPSEDRDVQSDRIAPGSARRVQIQYPKSIEKRLSSKGHYYYVNLHNNTSSNQNPLEWKQLPDGWGQKLSSKRQVYYYNKVSRVTQWDRPTEESDLDFSDTYII